MKLDVHTPGADTSTIEKLDAWENRWFPIAAATLERRFPMVHAQLFKNLSQTEGPAVAVSVRTLVERFDQMAAGAGSYGAEGAQAKAVLEARGLTQAVLNEARSLLETVGKVATVDAAMAAQDPKAIEKAESDLWASYIEWSQIARVAVTPRVLLRQMGFLTTRRSKATDDDVDLDLTAGVITSPSRPRRSRGRARERADRLHLGRKGRGRARRRELRALRPGERDFIEAAPPGATRSGSWLPA